MSGDIPNSRRRGSPNFQRIVDAFLLGEGLPFSSVLTAERIERVFAKHGCTFGLCGIYNAAITLWAFLGQVLRDGKEASCQAAVARVVSHCLQARLPVPSSDTGVYCRARAKLPEGALRELSCEVAAELKESVSPVHLWKGRPAKLIDGFTFTMPGTAKSQAKYPHPKTQKVGVGLPIASCVAILSLATASVMDAAIGPYSGKETGESALLRKLLGHFSPGDIAVMDKYYCSFMMIALLLARGTDTCTRRHHLRHFDFRRGHRLGKYDHIIEWTRPVCPKWMDKDVYARIPATLRLREIRFSIVEPGRRTQSIDIITTLLDPEQHTKEDIAELYGFRWNSELDIRSIKISLNLAHVRCQSPEMVHREFRTTILGYNLIRTTAASAAASHGKQPRQISFTGACQYVLGSWAQLSGGLIDSTLVEGYCLTLLQQIATCEVANRPGRLEPRVIRRRPNSYDLMQKPRNELKAELRKHCT